MMVGVLSTTVFWMVGLGFVKGRRHPTRTATRDLALRVAGLGDAALAFGVTILIISNLSGSSGAWSAFFMAYTAAVAIVCAGAVATPPGWVRVALLGCGVGALLAVGFISFSSIGGLVLLLACPLAHILGWELGAARTALWPAAIAGAASSILGLAAGFATFYVR